MCRRIKLMLISALSQEMFLTKVAGYEYLTFSTHNVHACVDVLRVIKSHVFTEILISSAVC